jgi:thiamine-monophosphate kinase
VKGADNCAVHFGTTIVGGDTKETDEITLCGTAFGTVKKEEFMSRTGARPGDIIAVTGTLGKAGAGYYALKRHCLEKKLSKALFEPVPRIKEGMLLARQHCVTSSMDLSDGLSASLYQLQECNSVGFELKKSALPLSSELFDLLDKNHTINPYTIALHFGGDYELLLTMPPDKFTKIQKIMKKQGTDLSEIGVVTRKQDIVLSDGKKKQIIENKGYEHFKRHSF